MRKTPTITAIVGVVALLIVWATAASASSQQEKEDALFPEFRAVVIYTASDSRPELREILGQFKNLQECLVYIRVREKTMTAWKEPYGEETFCQYHKMRRSPLRWDRP